MQKKYFYVYKWFNKDTNEVFYIGKGCKNRYKEIKQRNEYFKEYYNTHNCDVEIIEYFDTEEEAFAKEKELIEFFRNKGESFANLDDGGMGGCHFVWNEQKREYWSKHNPMKRPEQRQRMSDQNPMKDTEIAKKVGQKHRKKVLIDGIEYNGLVEAAEVFRVTDVTIGNWCRKGKNPQGLICSYVNQKTTRSKIGKKVIIDDKTFDTIKEAAEYIGCSSSNLGRILKENKTVYKDHTCRYANQQPS